MFPLRDTHPSVRFPLVTLVIVILNALVFFHELSLDEYSLNEFIYTFGTVPRKQDWLTLITSQFLHGGLGHFLGNMWFLWIYGDNVEDILGSARYALFYLLCGVAGGLLHVATNWGSAVPAIGASGAIAGVMGAYLIKFPQSRILMFTFPFFLFELPATFVLLFWVAMQVLGGFGTYGAESGTAFFAHIGGFVAGMILVNVFQQNEPYHTRRELYW